MASISFYLIAQLTKSSMLRLDNMNMRVGISTALYSGMMDLHEVELLREGRGTM
jgi:hypothetical protein